MIRANTFSFNPFSYRNHHSNHLPLITLFPTLTTYL
nr:MAG TPA: hypothetical protein [Caudoviricetes sp.]DAO68546.1 MAG TPA: hypothetical protein [Caudoviricetes sp.]